MKTIPFLFANLTIGLVFSTVIWAQKPVTDPMQRVIADLQAGNVDKAIAELTEAIKLHPDHVDAYLLRSNLRATSGDNPGALADITKVIELKPDMGSAYYGRSVLRLVNNDVSGAMKDLDAAVINNYKAEPVYVLRAQLRTQQNDLNGALTDLDEAIKLNPDNPSEYNSRAHLLLALGNKERAFADFNHLLTWYEAVLTKRQWPPSTKQYEKSITPPAGLSVAKEGSKAVASGTFSVGIDVKTVNQSPTDKEMIPVIAGAYVNRGLIHSSLGNADAAIADFTKSIQLSPSNAWVFYSRATELEGKGDLAGALSDIGKAIELDPVNGNFRLEHGVVLLLQGKTKEAQVDFDMLLKSDRVLWQKRIDDRIASVKKQLPSPPN